MRDSMPNMPNLSIQGKVGGKDDHTAREFYHHSSGQRIFTDAVLVESLSKQYDGMPLTVIPAASGFGTAGCDLLRYAAAGHAQARPIDESATCPLKWRLYLPPARRMDENGGAMADSVIFGKYVYEYKGEEYLLYTSSGRDGTASYARLDTQFLLGAETHVADELIREATKFGVELQDEIWVFDGGYWDKSAELFQSVKKASWDDVILDPETKKDIQNDVLRFFRSRERYDKLRVPWKRGIIYYGPPGNGKTVSIKAMMHSLYDLEEPVPTLYVRSLSSFGGPEYSIREIFRLARQQAPCLLVFEDLDSLVREDSRTYFLNEVDGLQVNEGVLMIGSTNYLERLDPGISKRPSRFDRKIEFPKPNYDERVQYSEYWRGKLSDNKDIEFPAALSKAIAKETDDFSFAYMQEAFVASLLAIANKEDWKAGLTEKEVEREIQKRMREQEHREADAITALKEKYDMPTWVSLATIEEVAPGSKASLDLDKLELWQQMKKQIKILREEM